VEFKICFHKWQGKAQGRRMIIELGNTQAKWKLLIENTCMLLANGNATMWNGTGLGVYGRVTNKGETNLYGRGRHCEARVKRDGDRETNIDQNRPCNLHQADPAHGCLLTSWSCMRASPTAV
jgi:hypothetical protein